MAYYGGSTYRDDSWIVGLVLVLFLVVMGTGIVLAAKSRFDSEKAHESAIGEQAYCVERYSDQYSAPLRCYKYFNLQQVGTYQSGKTTLPVLVPN